MATGYTIDIAKGITFNQFVMNCARAFGALVTMRDDSMDTPIPEKFEPSDWDKKKLIEANVHLTALNKMTLSEAKEKADKDYNDEVLRINNNLKENAVLLAKYNDMMLKVEAWQPPTPDHVELKNFMIQQIMSSIKYDNMSDYFNEHPAIHLSASDWIKKQKDEALRDIEYHTKEWNKECELTEQRNAWVKALRESLRGKS
jgi:NADH:ubiquinone oxidoreductase subunit